jgi:predicted amidophosphoribosyltransferase
VSISKKNKCKDCKKEIHKKSKYCADCDHKNRFYENLETAGRPSYLTLKKEIEQTSYTATGKKYGVSDNAVRKWLRKYERFGEINK